MVQTRIRIRIIFGSWIGIRIRIIFGKLYPDPHQSEEPDRSKVMFQELWRLQMELWKSVAAHNH
jgi:hypothetical protein